MLRPSLFASLTKMLIGLHCKMVPAQTSDMAICRSSGGSSAVFCSATDLSAEGMDIYLRERAGEKPEYLEKNPNSSPENSYHIEVKIDRSLRGSNPHLAVVDRFYIALFSTLEQTHCALVHQTPTEVVYSVIWLLHGWCQVKLLPSRRTFCVHHTTTHHGLLHKATYVGCMCI